MERIRYNRIFIAGHVFGLTDMERVEIRQRMNDAKVLFEQFDFEVVNPVDMMDEKGNRDDLLCRYYRLLMDCSSVVLYDDHAIYEECQTAHDIALIRNMCIWRENSNLLRYDIVRPVILAIARVMDLKITDYAGVKSRAENVIWARVFFAHFCQKRAKDLIKKGELDDDDDIQYRDIGNCLHGYSHNSAKTIVVRLNKQYAEWITNKKSEFRFYNYQIDKFLTEYDKNK